MWTIKSLTLDDSYEWLVDKPTNKNSKVVFQHFISRLTLWDNLLKICKRLLITKNQQLAENTNGIVVLFMSSQPPTNPFNAAF